MSNPRFKSVALLALVVTVFGVSLYALASRPVPTPTAAAIASAVRESTETSGKTNITWTPTSVSPILSPGESVTVSVSFIASRKIRRASVEISPGLVRLIRAEPATFERIRKGQQRTLNIIVAAAANATLGTVTGTIQLRRGKVDKDDPESDEDDRRDAGKLLPEALNVIVRVTVAPPSHYRIVDLTPIECCSNGNAIASGLVAGSFVSEVDGLTTHVSFWHDNLIDDLGRGEGIGINSSGQVITGNGDFIDHGDFIDTGGLARAVNDNGKVVGFLRGNTPGAYTWTATGGTVIIGNKVNPVAININGDIAGQTPDNSTAMVLTLAGEAKVLGTLPGDVSTSSSSINSQGHVAGESTSGQSVLDPELGTFFNPSRAFFWDGTTMHDLGLFDIGSFIPPLLHVGDTPNAIATGINDQDLVVGFDFYDYGNGFPVPEGILDATVPFVWSATTGAIDLNTLVDSSLGWQLRVANGIDQDGKIVGSGIAPDGIWHGFVLVPDP